MPLHPIAQNPFHAGIRVPTPITAINPLLVEMTMIGHGGMKGHESEGYHEGHPRIDGHHLLDSSSLFSRKSFIFKIEEKLQFLYVWLNSFKRWIFLTESERFPEKKK
jgi:hypothetical protein